MAYLELGKCRGCGAEIIWVTTANRKSMPVDAKPETRMVEIGAGSGVFEAKKAYVSHFATCPKAGEFRKLQ